MNQDKIKEIKQKYPKGTRIMLNSMDDPHHPVPTGTLGTVETVDDIGTIHMKWDNGQSLGLIVGEDSFYVIESVQNQEKIREAVKSSMLSKKTVVLTTFENDNPWLSNNPFTFFKA